MNSIWDIPHKKFKKIISIATSWDDLTHICNSNISTIKFRAKKENINTTHLFSHTICSKCGLKMWNNKPIAFKILKTPSMISKLCPNCYSQLKKLNKSPPVDIEKEITILGFSGVARRYNTSIKTVKSWLQK